MNLKGFHWRERDWSWPSFDEVGAMTMPAHALADDATACGEPWPHIHPRSEPCVPPAEQIASIKADPDAYLCPRCATPPGR